MLLEFKFKNFKTFQKETLFSMTPANKIKDIEYSVLKTKIGKKEYTDVKRNGVGSLIIPAIPAAFYKNRSSASSAAVFSHWRR